MRRLLFSRSLSKVLATIVLVALARGASGQWTKTNGPYGGSITTLGVMGNDLFAGTLAGAIYLSKNQGRSWANVSSGLPSIITRDMAVSGSNIFICNQLGVYFSSNQGASWTKVNNGLSGSYYSLLAAFGTSIATGSIYGNGIYVTHNNGASWSLAGTGITNGLMCLASSGTKLFAGTNGGGVLFSVDSGNSWTPVNTGLPAATYVKQLNVVGSGIFCTTVSQVYVSANNGSSWSLVGSVGAPFNSIPSSFTASGSNLFAGFDNTYQGVSLSTNNGASWTQVNNGLSCRLVTKMAAIGSNVFAGTWSSVFSTVNNGSNWAEQDSGLNSRPMAELIANGTDLYAGGEQGGAWYSNDSGYSWQSISNGLPIERGISALALKGSDLFAGTGTGMFVSANNGISWTAISSGLSTLHENNIYCIAVKGSDIFIGTQGGIFLSTNSGASWTNASSGLTAVSTHQILVKGSDLFAVTDNGVFRSTNNGSSWASVNTGLPTTYVSAIATDGVNLFAGLQMTGGVWVSASNGASWTQISNGIPITRRVVRSLAIDGTDIYAGVQSGGVYVSHDTGKNWASFSPGLDSSHIYKLTVAAGRMYCLPGEGGVWVYGKMPTPPPPGLSVRNPETTLFRLFPNPMTRSALLEFENPFKELSSFVLYDAAGRCVYKVDDIHTGSIRIPRGNLSSGHYYFRLCSGSQRIMFGKLVAE